jgi:hypothetical protein
VQKYGVDPPPAQPRCNAPGDLEESIAVLSRALAWQGASDLPAISSRRCRCGQQRIAR